MIAMLRSQPVAGFIVEPSRPRGFCFLGRLSPHGARSAGRNNEFRFSAAVAVRRALHERPYLLGFCAHSQAGRERWRGQTGGGSATLFPTFLGFSFSFSVCGTWDKASP